MTWLKNDRLSPLCYLSAKSKQYGKKKRYEFRKRTETKSKIKIQVTKQKKGDKITVFNRKCWQFYKTGTPTQVADFDG